MQLAHSPQQANRKIRRSILAQPTLASVSSPLLITVLYKKFALHHGRYIDFMSTQPTQLRRPVWTSLRQHPGCERRNEGRSALLVLDSTLLVVSFFESTCSRSTSRLVISNGPMRQNRDAANAKPVAA